MKKMIALLLAAVLAAGAAVPALAAPADEAEQAAWTLYHYGLFQGISQDSRGFPDFALEQTPTRAQGVTMLVRLLGKETAALNALLPKVLRRGTRACPDMEALSAALDAPVVPTSADQRSTIGQLRHVIAAACRKIHLLT